MHSLLRLTALSAFALFCGTHARAGAIVWKQKTVETQSDPSQNILEVRFPFTNEGKTAVNITQVESSCGCTTTELAQRHYEPGQSGEIVARYTIGAHTGTQRKTFAVHCSDQEEPDTLTLVARIPEMVRIEPAFVTWSKDEKPAPKKLVLQTAEGVTLDDVEMKSSNPAMEARLDATARGHRYEITVTPSVTDHFVFATLTIDCRVNKEMARTFRAYATVKPTPASPGDDRDERPK